MDVSLTGGWLPMAVQVLSGAILLAAVGWRSGAWRMRVLAPAFAVGFGLVGALHWFIGYQGLADDPAPIALWLWTAASGLAAVIALAGWRGTHWWRRSASLLAIPLCALCAVLAINAWTGYLPTLGSAWNRAAGTALPTETDEAGVTQMRQRHDKPTRGTLVTVKIGDDASGFRHRDELVYLPPAWFASDPPPPLPAVVMADSEFGHPTDWPSSGDAQHTADDFAAAHGGNSPVLVFTDTSGEFTNDTECVNGTRGNAADHLTKDVVPYVISHFGVSKDRANWGIVGWSTGGTCALTTAVTHPDLFSAFVDIDGEMGPNAGSKKQTIARLFGGDETAFAAFDPATVMTSHGTYSGLAGWFGISGGGPAVDHLAGATPPPTQLPEDVDNEDHAAVAGYLCSLASSDGIPCAVVPVDGGHDWGTAAKVFAAALPWLAGRLGTPTVQAIPMPGAAPAY